MKYIILFTLLCSLPALARIKKQEKATIKEQVVLIEDVVYKLMPVEGKHKVLFKQHAGIYYLHSGVKDHDVLKKALEESQKSGTQVKLNADPTSLELKELLK